MSKKPINTWMGVELGVHHYTHVCAVELTCTQVLS